MRDSFSTLSHFRKNKPANNKKSVSSGKSVNLSSLCNAFENYQSETPLILRMAKECYTQAIGEKDPDKTNELLARHATYTMAYETLGKKALDMSREEIHDLYKK